MSLVGQLGLILGPFSLWDWAPEVTPSEAIQAAVGRERKYGESHLGLETFAPQGVT